MNNYNAWGKFLNELGNTLENHEDKEYSVYDWRGYVNSDGTWKHELRDLLLLLNRFYGEHVETFGDMAARNRYANLEELISRAQALYADLNNTDINVHVSLATELIKKSSELAMEFPTADVNSMPFILLGWSCMIYGFALQTKITHGSGGYSGGYGV